MSLLFYSVIAVIFAFTNQAQEASRIHRDAIVVDGHNDLLMSVMDGENIERRRDTGHSDLVRLREGGVDVQVFSIWVPPAVKHARGYTGYADEEIDSLDTIISRNRYRVEKVTNIVELRECLKQGKLACLYGLEGGHPIGKRLENLYHFFKRGVRYIGLTWNNSTSWATSARDEAAGKKGGLTPFGRKIVHAMDSLGILIDISHLGPTAVRDVLAETRNPVIASHSSCDYLAHHYRNLTDDQLRAIAGNGGVVMINFYPRFIDSSVTKTEMRKLKRYAGEWKTIAKKYANNPDRLVKERKKFLATRYPQVHATLRRVVDHIDHVVLVAGIDHVGIGSDFDGISVAPLGLEDVTHLPELTAELLRRGYSETNIKKILGGNFIRVFSRVCVN
ncbi:MAG: membrane dipeptidase [Chlorobi bacterium]|nr:membrane dipeptidase [Chlorobiota bacterium]